MYSDGAVVLHYGGIVSQPLQLRLGGASIATTQGHTLSTDIVSIGEADVEWSSCEMEGGRQREREKKRGGVMQLILIRYNKV